MRFVDATATSRIHDEGISFGASAGDVNGDGLPDIFTSGHYGEHPHLWLNLGNGTFWDVTGQMVPLPSGDMHGAVWVDIDADGSQELVLMRGANYGLTPTPKFVYKRFGALIIDVAAYIGLDVPLMRARTPVALDYNEDGRTDMFLTAVDRPDGLAPPGPHVQGNYYQFQTNWPTTGFNLNSMSLFATHGDLNGDQRLDLLVHAFPTKAYSYNATGLTEITSTIGLPPSAPTMTDALIADLTGDGQNEVFITRAPSTSSFCRRGDRRVECRTIVAGYEHGVTIPIAGPHTLTFDWGPLPWYPRSSVFIGAGGYQPTTDAPVLSPTNPANVGIAPHTPGQSTGIYIGWDPAAQAWQVVFSSPIWSECMLRMVSTAPTGPVTAIGWSPTAVQAGDMLLKRVNGTYTNVAASSGIPPFLNSRSVVAADFDNDMDLDLFVVTATTSANTPDVLLENDGTGHFTVVSAGDAHGSDRGIGDSAITLDYDRDGKVDLFVVNGDATAFRQGVPSDAFADNGPVQLFRNRTANQNHWLGIHLVGTSSNADGIGARVEVTAGNRLQVREAGGGMHRYSQNHGIHFGLGTHTTANVTVRWPNGVVTQLPNVAVDRYLTIVQ